VSELTDAEAAFIAAHATFVSARDAFRQAYEREHARAFACKCGITQLEPNELCSQHGGAKG